MKLKAIDQIHISSVSADTIKPGTEFEVSDAAGAELLQQNPHALQRVRSAAVKAEQVPLNKAEVAPANKATNHKRASKGA